MAFQEDESPDGKNKPDPDANTTSTTEDTWSKYKKVRKVGRVERTPGYLFSQRNNQILTVTDNSAHNFWKNKEHDSETLPKPKSSREICPTEGRAVPSGAVHRNDSAGHFLHSDSAGHFLHSDSAGHFLHSDSAGHFLHSDSAGHFLHSAEHLDTTADIASREKKHSITVSIHEEIRKSFSKTRSLSVTVIKNIFKKSKTFHSSSDTLISSARPPNAADAIIPNFIFKYHTEDVDDPLPQSAKTGWVRQCWSAFSMGLNTLVCGILLGLMSSNDSILMTIQFCGRSQQNLLLIWLKYAFIIGCCVSSLLWWKIIDYFGRKVTNLLCSFILLISFTLYLISEDFTNIVIGFALGGMSSSSCFINSYFYLPECVEEKMFIPTSVIFSSMLFLGIYLTNLVLMWFTFHYLVYVSISLLLLSLACVSFLPESPAFYFKKNDVENARKSISWFKDRKNEILVSYEMTIVLSKFTEKNKSLSWTCFRSKANMNALYLSLVCMVGTALNTCVFFKLYPPVAYLFVENLRPLGVNSIIFILPILILAASIKVLVTSRRKKLLVTSYCLVAISLVLLSVLWNFVSFRLPGDDVEQMFTDWLFLLSFVMFSVSFLLSSFIVPHVLYFEIFSHETMSSCLSVLYGFGTMLTLIFVSLSPYLPFIGFGTCLFLMSLFFITLSKLTSMYLPETKGEVFQKIRKKFRGIRNLQRSKKVSIFTIGDSEIDV